MPAGEMERDLDMNGLSYSECYQKTVSVYHKSMKATKKIIKIIANLYRANNIF